MTGAVWRRLLFLLVLGLTAPGNLAPASASLGGPLPGGARQAAVTYEYDGRSSDPLDLRFSGSLLTSQPSSIDPFTDHAEGRGRHDFPPASAFSHDWRGTILVVQVQRHGLAVWAKVEQPERVTEGITKVPEHFSLIVGHFSRRPSRVCRGELDEHAFSLYLQWRRNKSSEQFHT